MEKPTSAQVQKYLAEALDPNKATLICEKHFYIGDGPATDGCSSCFMVKLVRWYGALPPHLREQELDKLERTLNVMAELEDKGKFNVSLFKHPVIEIERDSD